MAHTVGTKDNFVPWLAKLGYYSLYMRTSGVNYQSAALWHANLFWGPEVLLTPVAYEPIDIDICLCMNHRTAQWKSREWNLPAFYTRESPIHLLNKATDLGYPFFCVVIFSIHYLLIF